MQRKIIVVSIGIFIAWLLLLDKTSLGDFILAICVVFSIISITATSVVFHFKHRSDPNDEALGSGQGPLSRIKVFTGELSRRQALVQVYLVPIAVTVAFLALAFVDIAERTTT